MRVTISSFIVISSKSCSKRQHRLSQCLPPVGASDARSMNFSSKPIGYAEHLHKVIGEAIHLAETFQLRLAKFASLIQCRGASAVAGDGVPIRYTLEDDGVVEGDHAAPPVNDLTNELLMTSSPVCWQMQ